MFLFLLYKQHITEYKIQNQHLTLMSLFLIYKQHITEQTTKIKT